MWQGAAGIFEGWGRGWVEFLFSKAGGRVDGIFEGVLGRGGNFLGCGKGLGGISKEWCRVVENFAISSC